MGSSIMGYSIHYIGTSRAEGGADRVEERLLLVEVAQEGPDGEGEGSGADADGREESFFVFTELRDVLRANDVLILAPG